MTHQKQKRGVLLALVATGLIGSATLSSTAAADNPFDRFVPRGRLLRKLRDDLTGSNSKEKEKPGTPTPADRKGKTPTPAGKPPQQAKNSRQPTPANQRKTASPTSASSQNKTAARQQPAAARKQKPAVGFGMTYKVDKNESVRVSKVDPTGNAAKAGIRPGDTLTTAGGAKVTGTEELDEIGKVLGAGDELEFQINRRGKASKVTVQFGETPDVGETAPAGASVAQRSASPAGDSPVGNNKTGSYRGNYSFVPEPAGNNNGFKSVLERPTSQPRQLTRARQVVAPSRQFSPSGQSGGNELESTVAQQRQQILQLQRQLQQARQQQQQAPVGSGLRLDGPAR